ncbi:hypothetical protein WA026_020626 [Henosepilachna vigintioctopunctata]|uniref:Major facilitator superfamily (MFS) profile domain-containing protein n=1 Tax=Henosepilachna vigintioctopunctata TaxID=420089 RepID=A0AAW1UUQ2_9CUCU
MNQDRAELLKETNENVVISRGGYETLGDSSPEISRYSGQTKTFPQYVAALTATLTAFLAGMVLGWTSPMMDSLFAGNFNHLTISTSQMGWIGSFATLGAMTMCIPTGFVCDLIGRKKTLLAISIPFIIGWLLILFSKSVIYLYLGRLISGMGFGASCVAAPIYISEISEKQIRGTLGSYFQLMIASGILASYVAGTFMAPLSFTIFCAGLPFLFIIVFLCQPESPVFLMKKGLIDEARCSLIRLRGSEADVTEELAEIEGILKESGQTATSIIQTFRRYSNLKALLISFSLMLFQQFCGINAVILYSANIFSTAGVKLNDDICTIILGLTQVIATLFSSFMVDKLGRRVLMISSTLMVGLSTIALAVYYTLKDRFLIDKTIMDHLNLIPIISLGCFIIMFSIGLGPLPWIIGSEIFPPEVKSMACSGAGTLNMFSAFLITKFFLDVSQNIGDDCSFYIFSLFSLMGTIFTYFVLPETKGKSIEDIQFELSL